MNASPQPDGVSALELESGVWLVTCRSTLDTPAAVDELQDACLAALDQGLRLLVVVADILLAQEGRLLLACRDVRGESRHLIALEGEARAALGRIVDERSLGVLSGQSAAEGVRRV
jgi:hypothetical protein